MMKRWALGAVAALALAGCGRAPETDLQGRWEVQEIAGASLGEGVDIWMEFAEEGDGVRGFTGCNAFATTVTSFQTGIAFAPPAEEPGECADQAAATDEARFLGVLPSVQRYIRHGRSLELLPATEGSEALIRLRLADETGG
jgi:heat shock protein HslJ